MLDLHDPNERAADEYLQGQEHHARWRERAERFVTDNPPSVADVETALDFVEGILTPQIAARIAALSHARDTHEIGRIVDGLISEFRIQRYLEAV